jgi:hypothetical protein
MLIINKTVEVFAIGCEVKVGSTTGVISGIILRDNSYLKYEIVYWDGPNRKVDWFDQFEVKKVDTTTTTVIGFHSESQC